MTRNEWKQFENMFTTDLHNSPVAVGWTNAKVENATADEVIQILNLYEGFLDALSADRCSVATRHAAADAFEFLLGAYLKTISVAESTADDLTLAHAELAQTA